MDNRALLDLRFWKTLTRITPSALVDKICHSGNGETKQSFGRDGWLVGTGRTAPSRSARESFDLSSTTGHIAGAGPARALWHFIAQRWEDRDPATHDQAK